MVDSVQSPTMPLILSIVGPLMNKVKLSMLSAKKNQNLAEKLQGTINVLAEQVLPHYIAQNKQNYAQINKLHNLCFLLASKAQNVFNSRIINTCLDRNLDMQGFSQVLDRILKHTGCSDYSEVINLINTKIRVQNLQSNSCLKSISMLLRKKTIAVEENDLVNILSTYESQFEFLLSDIQQYRNQQIKPESLSIQHSQPYDLNKVDLKYIVNNDMTERVCNQLRTQNAKVFWLTFFKHQSAVSADDFFGAIRELANLNKVPQFYETNLNEYQRVAIANDYIFSLTDHAHQIGQLVQQVIDQASRLGFNALQDQIKACSFASDSGSNQIITLPNGLTLQENPQLQSFKNDFELRSIQMRELFQSELDIPVDLQRTTFKVLPICAAPQELRMKFEAINTKECRNQEISIDGSQGIYKIGDGEANHYQVPNDKKLSESQLMIVCKDGKYYIRDLGIVHNSRIKVDVNNAIQIQQDTIVELGKVVLYHFDKVTHTKTPQQQPSSSFYIMRPNSDDYDVQVSINNQQDLPMVRAHPTWVSSEENEDLVQKEILLEANSEQHSFSIGRSSKREVPIKLKALSNDHCNINYEQNKGWYISESGKQKASSNGTYVFMKSLQQMKDHEPSSLVPLHDGMVISFIDFKIRVNLINPQERAACSPAQAIPDYVQQQNHVRDFSGQIQDISIKMDEYESYRGSNYSENPQTQKISTLRSEKQFKENFRDKDALNVNQIVQQVQSLNELRFKALETQLESTKQDKCDDSLKRKVEELENTAIIYKFKLQKLEADAIINAQNDLKPIVKKVESNLINKDQQIKDIRAQVRKLQQVTRDQRVAMSSQKSLEQQLKSLRVAIQKVETKIEDSQTFEKKFEEIENRAIVSKFKLQKLEADAKKVGSQINNEQPIIEQIDTQRLNKKFEDLENKAIVSKFKLQKLEADAIISSQDNLKPIVKKVESNLINKDQQIRDIRAQVRKLQQVTRDQRVAVNENKRLIAQLESKASQRVPETEKVQSDDSLTKKVEEIENRAIVSKFKIQKLEADAKKVDSQTNFDQPKFQQIDTQSLNKKFQDLENKAIVSKFKLQKLESDAIQEKTQTFKQLKSDLKNKDQQMKDIRAQVRKLQQVTRDHRVAFSEQESLESQLVSLRQAVQKVETEAGPSQNLKKKFEDLENKALVCKFKLQKLEADATMEKTQIIQQLPIQQFDSATTQSFEKKFEDIENRALVSKFKLQKLEADSIISSQDNLKPIVKKLESNLINKDQQMKDIRAQVRKLQQVTRDQRVALNEREDQESQLLSINESIHKLEIEARASLNSMKKIEELENKAIVSKFKLQKLEADAILSTQHNLKPIVKRVESNLKNKDQQMKDIRAQVRKLQQVTRDHRVAISEQESLEQQLVLLRQAIQKVETDVEASQSSNKKFEDLENKAIMNKFKLQKLEADAIVDNKKMAYLEGQLLQSIKKIEEVDSKAKQPIKNLQNGAQIFQQPIVQKVEVDATATQSFMKKFEDLENRAIICKFKIQKLEADAKSDKNQAIVDEQETQDLKNCQILNKRKVAELGAKFIQNNQKITQLELCVIDSKKQLCDHKNVHLGLNSKIEELHNETIDLRSQLLKNDKQDVEEQKEAQQDPEFGDDDSATMILEELQSSEFESRIVDLEKIAVQNKQKIIELFNEAIQSEQLVQELQNEVINNVQKFNELQNEINLNSDKCEGNKRRLEKAILAAANSDQNSQSSSAMQRSPVMQSPRYQDKIKSLESSLSQRKTLITKLQENALLNQHRIQKLEVDSSQMSNNQRPLFGLKKP